MSAVIITNRNSTLPALKAKYCISFFSRFMGLMFRKFLPPHDGVLLVEASDSRLNASIHMFFMNFDIAVIWINSNLTVVDKVLAKRWKPYYAPRAPARYILETNPDLIDAYKLGDQVTFSYE